MVISDANCTDTSACMTVSGLNIQESMKEDYLSIYPNPTNGSIHILTNQMVKQVLLLDMTGKEIMRAQSTELDLTDLNSGIYIIHVELQDSDQQLFQRVIKN